MCKDMGKMLESIFCSDEIVGFFFMNIDMEKSKRALFVLTKL